MSDPFVRPDTSAFLTFLNSQDGPAMHELPIADARNMMQAMRHVADADVGETAVKRDLAIPGPAGTIPARLYQCPHDLNNANANISCNSHLFGINLPAPTLC